MEITAIVVAIISVLGQIILLIFQRKQAQTQAKKTENEASSILIDKALNINKQETENLRILLDVIKVEYKEALVTIDIKDNEIKKLKNTIDFINKKFKRIITILIENNVDLKIYKEIEKAIEEENKEE